MIRIPWRVRTWLNKWRLHYYSRLYASMFDDIGANFRCQGPCLIRKRGRISIGNNVMFDASGNRGIELSVAQGSHLTIGNDVYVNHSTSIICSIRVEIGHRCLIASNVHIMDEDGHPVDYRSRHDYRPTTPDTRLGAPIILENNVWLGTRAIVLKGVTIGEGTVVGAGAVVTQSLPPGVLVVGVPARVIRDL